MKYVVKSKNTSVEFSFKDYVTCYKLAKACGTFGGEMIEGETTYLFLVPPEVA